MSVCIVAPYHLLRPEHLAAVVPLTVEPAGTTPRQAATNGTHHAIYNGTVLFRNTFDGKLPASDYPKVNVGSHHNMSVPTLTIAMQFYFSMFLVYSALAVAWGWLCYQNVQDLLPIQVRDICQH